ncbi:hypothetical protein GGR57DRAFT_457100 [Xylariaceae sp. FL1272]|nr:hypothetical protein GGR57DRAFT_457100 [Xylariaceae sp. FL1272]
MCSVVIFGRAIPCLDSSTQKCPSGQSCSGLSPCLPAPFFDASLHDTLMTPPDERTNFRGRRRSHHACIPCRRKKTRCPGERPACSSCSRLKQPCSYAPVIKPPSRGGPSVLFTAYLP